MRHRASSASSASFSGNSTGAKALIAVLTVVVLALAIGVSSASAATPEVKIDPTVNPGYTSVSVSGEVDPKGDPVEWFFELSTDGGANWEQRNFINFSEENGPQSFTDAMQDGLTPGTTYKIRIGAFDYATEEHLTSSEPSPEFTTKPVTAPSVSLDPITTKTDTTALIEGTVDTNSPGGLDDAGKAAYLTYWQFQCNPGCPGLEEHELEAEAGEEEVEFQATGLEPNTTYEVSITARNAGGESSDGPQTFATDEVAPTVNAAPGSALGEGKFQLAGTVNPHNSAITSCEFEYGLTTSYGSTAPCETIPATVNKPVFVTTSVSGLAIGTEYHFRITAANGADPTSSDDLVFTPSALCPNEAIREEQGSTFLPGCRAWEQVTSPFKGGFAASFNGFAAPGITPDGNRALYLSLGSFAGNEQGSAGSANQYVATRSASGWKTESIGPPVPNYTIPLTYSFSTSPDFRSTLWSMSTSDQSQEELDFFRRDENGVFHRIGPIEDPATLPPAGPIPTPARNGPTPEYLAVSDDLSRIVFKRPDERIYEYNSTSSGDPELADLDNQGQRIGACPEEIGRGVGRRGGHPLSRDGRVLIWTALCAGGDPSTRSGEIYARVGPTAVSVSAAQCTGPCVSSPPAAEFENLAADHGSDVFFTTSTQLLDEDADETSDLYDCEIPAEELAPTGPVNSCPSLIKVSGPSTNADVLGVVSVSESGSHVYFVARGVLAANTGANGDSANVGANNLYLWRKDAVHPDGATTFLASLNSSDSSLWEPIQGSEAQTADSGKVLVLPSYTQLISSGKEADTDGGARDLYRYDEIADQFNRLSVDSSGGGGNQQGVDAHTGAEPSFAQPGTRAHPSASDDGQQIAFATTEQLSPFDHNQGPDNYLWDRGRVFLISGGQPDSEDGRAPYAGNLRATVSASGEDVLIQTADKLAGTDTDFAPDLYDVRINGGFTSPVGKSPCISESGCRQSSAPVPASPGPHTVVPGGGNPPAVTRCGRGKVRRHGRCVKRHRKKAAHHKRHGKAGGK